jgi:hypothetical protein
MNLTERERIVLQLSQQGLSDYKIARKINTDPPSITRSRKNAHKKLIDAARDLEWTAIVGINLQSCPTRDEESGVNYSFFL